MAPGLVRSSAPVEAGSQASRKMTAYAESSLRRSPMDRTGGLPRSVWWYGPRVQGEPQPSPERVVIQPPHGLRTYPDHQTSIQIAPLSAPFRLRSGDRFDGPLRVSADLAGGVELGDGLEVCPYLRAGMKFRLAQHAQARASLGPYQGFLISQC
jgi:hypothetical protein